MADEGQPEALKEEEITEPTAEEQSEDKKDEYSGPADIVTIEDAGPCKKKVTIEIAREKIDYTTDKQYKELGKEAIIPGFRKGRAPRRLLEKRFGKETTEQIKLTLMADASKSAIEENKLQSIGEPDIDTEKRFLWSSKLECQGDLDKGTISDELRREFEDNKAPLSTQATISVEQPESSWLITDGLNKYPIRKIEQQLNIYEKTELPAEGTLKFDFEVEVRPEFELPQLEGIPVTKTKLEVTDEQVDREIEQIQRWAGVWAPREEDGSVEIEDQIIADAALKIEGVEEEQKLDNVEIYVRQNGFVGAIPVEKLDELLVGAKIGETKETSVEVPKTFFREEYRGKKVDIKIDIKDIKWLKSAELDENFLKRYDVEDKDELREKIQDTLHSRLEGQSRTEMTEQIYKYLLDKTEFDLPLDVVAEQANSVLQRQYTNLLMRGLSREQIGEQIEQLKAGSEQKAQEQLKTFFIMDKVADKLEIEVSEEEINGHIAQLAMQRGQRPERMREDMERNGSLAQFTLEVRLDKCIAKLLETAVITEKKPETKAKKTRKSAKKSEKKTEKKSSDK
jgi:trigger factor